MGDEPPVQLPFIRPTPASPDSGHRDKPSSPPPEPLHPSRIATRAHRAPTPATAPTTPAPTPQRVTFDRRELDAILNIYGRMVAAGEWRDYAIDFTRDKAVFSIFRRTADVPVYRIEKDPRLARKQGAYSVVSQTGLILKRGHELPRVLAVLEKPLRVV